MGETVFIVLTLTACLADLPEVCQVVFPPGPSFSSEIGCLQQAQWRAVEWKQNNPGYTVTKFGCTRSNDKNVRQKLEDVPI